MSGDLDGSLEKLNQARALFELIRDAGGLGHIEYLTGHVYRAKGNISGARERLIDAITRFTEVGDRPSMALALETLAGAELDGGRPDHTAFLFGATDSIREQTGAAIPSTRVDEVQRDRAAAATVLGESRYLTEVDRGRALDLALVIQELAS
jgi:hypothetical protein